MNILESLGVELASESHSRPGWDSNPGWPPLQRLPLAGGLASATCLPGLDTETTQ